MTKDVVAREAAIAKGNRASETREREREWRPKTKVRKRNKIEE